MVHAIDAARQRHKEQNVLVCGHFDVIGVCARTFSPHHIYALTHCVHAHTL